MIKSALEKFAASSAREWETDRSQTVGASEIGQCARRVYFSKNEGDAKYGKARDEEHEDRWGAKVRGSTYESAYWVPALQKEFNVGLLYAGNDQRTFTEGFLSATPDGLLIGLDRFALSYLGVPDLGNTINSIMVECKTADPRTRLDHAKPEHVYQVQVQMGLVRSRTNHKPDHAIISYTDTSFWDEVKEFAIKFEPEIFENAKTRAMQIMTATDASQLRPEGVIAGGKECDYCPFTTACGVARARAVPEKEQEKLAPELIYQITLLARDAKELKTQAKTIKAKGLSIEHDIRDLLAKGRTKRLTWDGVSVLWSAVKGRPAWDDKALRKAAAAAGIDIDKYQTVGDPADRLTITIAQTVEKAA